MSLFMLVKDLHVVFSLTEVATQFGYTDCGLYELINPKYLVELHLVNRKVSEGIVMHGLSLVHTSRCPLKFNSGVPWQHGQ